MTQKLLSPKELADMIGVTVRTLQMWRMFGEGPDYKRLNGRLIRYHIDDVNAYLRRTTKRGTHENPVKKKATVR